jgi:hypothetical protein
MQRMQRNWLPILLGCSFILLVSIPYIWAYQNSDQFHSFGGFLLNPIDGNSYLAKMYQGWEGNWRFHLPYTAEPGEGGYLFLFYLALGHLSRITSLENQTVFHLARIAGALALVFSLWNFFAKIFDQPRIRWIAFGFSLFGSGLGWLAASTGVFSADLWVAEGYPFLAAYANPHFPLGLAILLSILALAVSEADASLVGLSRLNRFWFTAGGFLLAIILPFGVVIAVVVLSGSLVWGIWDITSAHNNEHTVFTVGKSQIIKTGPGHALVYVLLGGGPVLAYQFWVSNSDPVLLVWNTQNITISPAIWDLIFSYAPILMLALPGAILLTRAHAKKARILVVWAVLGLLLLYIPWSLQRRFISGYMIPLAGLAAFGLENIFAWRRSFGIAALVLVIVLIIPTNLMILLGGLQAVHEKNESIFLSGDEIQGLSWLENNTEERSLILASPQMGLYIPAYTGRRVFYGHPYETADALKMEALVVEFFSAGNNDRSESAIQGADYIFIGDRERQLGAKSLGPDYRLVYEAGDVQIFEFK